MTIGGPSLVLFAVATVLVIVVAAIFFYLSRRLKRRRDVILTELAGKPELVQDRAFNRLAMARREVELLARTGAEPTRAHELIAEAQGAFDTHQYARAYELAQSAHESLVIVRQRGTLPSGSPSPGSASVARNPTTDALASGSGPRPPPAPPLPRNRAESQFQLRLLEQELLAGRAARPSDGGTLEAANLQHQAQASFDRGEFTDAFRLALRARRTLGGKVESLAPPPPATVGAGGIVAPLTPVDPASVAEGVAGGERCASCGYPALADDTFCRGCGTPRTPPTCPSCGARRGRADTFCGRCGARFAT